MIDGKLHSVDDLADKDIAQFLQDNQQQEVHVLTPTPIDAFTANTAFVLAHEVSSRPSFPFFRSIHWRASPLSFRPSVFLNALVHRSSNQHANVLTQHHSSSTPTRIKFLIRRLLSLAPAPGEERTPGPNSCISPQRTSAKTSTTLPTSRFWQLYRA